MSPQTYKILISGQVQGVGFRPFIYNLFNSLKINGIVYNSNSGVYIFCNTNKNEIENIISKIKNNSPVLSKIKSIEYQPVEYQMFNSFRILKSDNSDTSLLSINF